MEISNLVYIIPPYLLNTCLGSHLQKKLCKKDVQLAQANVVALDSKQYQSKIEESKASGCQFSRDPVINKLIRDKLIYKLTILGVLGDPPARPEEVDDEYLTEMYETFKSRIVEEENTEEEANEESVSYTGLSSTSSVSKLSLPGIADINWSDPEYLVRIPVRYHKYVSLPLKQLLGMAKTDANFKHKSPPSFVKLSENEFFDYPLPISWVPLISNKFLGHLTKKFNMDISNSSGYSQILMSSPVTEDYDEEHDDTEDPPKNIYYNFVCDKVVNPSAGIFYYETEILQETTEATDFKPIILMSDTASCSNSSLNVSLGFVNRIIDFDAQGKSNSSAHADLDLETVKNDIISLQQDKNNPDLPEDIEILLTSRPGEFKGSFGLSIEDSTFYNSSRNSDSMQRTSLLNMNRRLSSFNRSSITDNDTSKFDIGISFKSHRISEVKKKIFKSDIIGCGINFIEKSILFTLNGVLVRTITNEEIMTSNLSNEGIFSDKRGNSIYPMLGFKVSDIKDIIPGQPSVSKVVTNFGFKEFKFNIDGYAKGVGKGQERNFYMLTRETKFDYPDNSSDLNTSSDNNSQLINNLIKGYLNHEGYLETLNAFGSDLQQLCTKLNDKSDEDGANDLLKSHVSNRQIVKKYLINEKYDSAVKFLSINYPSIFQNEDGEELLFQIKLQKYLYLFKNYFEAEYDESNKNLRESNFNSVFQCGVSLQNEYKDDTRRVGRINSISSLLLVDPKRPTKKLPKSIKILQNYESNKNTLIENINKKILGCLGYNEVSNLENLFTNVENNINTLSLKHNDNQFMMINFEKDNIDL